MNKIAKFEKVSFERFRKDFINCFYQNVYSTMQVQDVAKLESGIKSLYDAIPLPKRSTMGSAGYDFIAPTDINIPFGHSAVIPTGIRCRIENGWFLDLNPRSGHGFKKGIRLANTRGIVDSDYYGADNEGHILVKLVNDCPAVNDAKAAFEVAKGNAICQGIFTVYGITEDDDTTGVRTGGFGSTDKK